MPTIDIFNNDAFSAATLTGEINRVPYMPTFLGDLDLFVDVPIRTTDIWIDDTQGTLKVLQTDQRGSPPVQRTRETRKARAFRTVRIAEADSIRASELQNMRAAGTESEFVEVQAEVARRLSGPTGIMRDVELTWENMRMGAIQGIVVDKDGSVIYNFFDEFGLPQPAEIDFDLDNAAPASGAVRKKCDDVQRRMARAAQGAFLRSTRIIGLCGDAFWYDLVNHPEVRQTYLGQQEASDLRKGTAFGTLDYGSITFVNYRGTDDNSAVAVGVDKCAFFPSGAPGVFQRVLSPAETFDFVNTLGQPMYAWTVQDEKRNAYVDIECYSYPLFLCTRPQALLRAKRT